MSMESAFAVDATGRPGAATPPSESVNGSWRAFMKQPLIGCVCGILGRLIDCGCNHHVSRWLPVAVLFFAQSFGVVCHPSRERRLTTLFFRSTFPHPLGKIVAGSAVPFDTIKTRMQTASLDALQARLQARAGAVAIAVPAFTPMESSPLQCLRNTVSREGVRGLYRGCITPCMGAAVEDSISFSVYHSVARLIGAPPPHRLGQACRPEDLPLLKVFVAGACGGMSTSFLVTPLELIKCRLQTDRVARAGQAGGAAPRYAGPIDCLLQSVRAEGLRVLYRGHSATVAREGLGTGVWFTTYELGLRSLAPNVPRENVPTPIVLLAGATSGVMLNGVPYPFDTAKSVLQTLQAPPITRGGGGAVPIFTPPRGLWHAFKLIVETEGIAGLYRGITPALLRAMPTNAAVFLIVSFAPSAVWLSASGRRFCSSATP